jgi:hypothetical protein
MFSRLNKSRIATRSEDSSGLHAFSRVWRRPEKARNACFLRAHRRAIKKWAYDSRCWARIMVAVLTQQGRPTAIKMYMRVRARNSAARRFGDPRCVRQQREINLHEVPYDEESQGFRFSRAIRAGLRKKK